MREERDKRGWRAGRELADRGSERERERVGSSSEKSETLIAPLSTKAKADSRYCPACSHSGQPPSSGLTRPDKLSALEYFQNS